MKTIRKITLAIATLSLALSTQAQNTNGTIQGKVFEQADSTLSVIGASVFIEHNGEKIGVATNIDGKYKISAVPPGVYNLTISHTAYQKQVVNSVEVKPNSISFIPTVYLNADNTLPVLTLRPKDYLIDKENPTKMTKTFKDLAHSPNIQNPAKLIQSFSPEIKMSEDGQQLYFRGSRSDATTYYIDGVRTQGLQPIPGTAIGSMTVYTGGVPAKYGDTTGGVVVMETKSYSQLYNNWKAMQSRK